MKTNKIFSLFVLTGTIILSSCGIQAHVQKTPGTDLSNYKTYAWLSSKETREGKSKSYKNFQESYLKKTIGAQLQKKGLTEVTGTPDISVDYDIQVQNEHYTKSKAVYSKSYIGYRYNPYTGYMEQVYYPSRYVGNQYRQVPYKSGNITVNIVDNKTNEVAWQGWAETAVDRKKLTTDEMDGIVKAIFKKYKN